MIPFFNAFFSEKSILIVEDDPLSSLLLKEYLSEIDVSVVESDCGSLAFSKFEKSGNIALVLLDIRLPDESGLILASRMKILRPGIPIIAQTALAMGEDKQRIKISCCDGYLTKPICKQDLFNCMFDTLK